LANQLKQKGVAFDLLDNAFAHIDDCSIANQLVQQMDIQQLHTWLDELIPQYCPLAESLHLSYHWSIWQAEFSTDLVFHRQATLQAFYPLLLETLITAVKPADVSHFPGTKIIWQLPRRAG
jgi:hypothetical protein